jgi:hypothetical protein
MDLVNFSLNRENKLKVVVLQSNYVPWKGYFDLIGNSDVCVFLDTVQFTKNDWRNRNRIKTKSGELRWMSIPVGQSIQRKIRDVELPSGPWRQKHLDMFEVAYSECPFYEEAVDVLNRGFSNSKESLSGLNQNIITHVTEKYISTKVTFLNDLDVIENPSEFDKNTRLVEILRELGATQYLSGPSATSYINTNEIEKIGVEVKYANYQNYREYVQSGEEFHHQVTFLDVIAWNGLRSSTYLKNEELF